MDTYSYFVVCWSSISIVSSSRQYKVTMQGRYVKNEQIYLIDNGESKVELVRNVPPCCSDDNVCNQCKIN